MECMGECMSVNKFGLECLREQVRKTDRESGKNTHTHTRARTHTHARTHKHTRTHKERERERERDREEYVCARVCDVINFWSERPLGGLQTTSKLHPTINPNSEYVLKLLLPLRNLQ